MKTIVLLSILGVALSCAGPRVVVKTTATKDQMKLLYVQDNVHQGIIRCEIVEEGKLDKCKELAVHLND